MFIYIYFRPAKIPVISEHIGVIEKSRGKMGLTFEDAVNAKSGLAITGVEGQVSVPVSLPQHRAHLRTYRRERCVCGMRYVGGRGIGNYVCVVSGFPQAFAT